LIIGHGGLLLRVVQQMLASINLALLRIKPENRIFTERYYKKVALETGFTSFVLAIHALNYLRGSL